MSAYIYCPFEYAAAEATDIAGWNACVECFEWMPKAKLNEDGLCPVCQEAWDTHEEKDQHEPLNQD